MVKSNSKDLVALSVLGEVTSAVWPATRQYRVGHTGQLAVLPGTGGICYSHVIGDSNYSGTPNINAPQKRANHL